jgi:hypothetical protein
VLVKKHVRRIAAVAVDEWRGVEVQMEQHLHKALEAFIPLAYLPIVTSAEQLRLVGVVAVAVCNGQPVQMAVHAAAQQWLSARRDAHARVTLNTAAAIVARMEEDLEVGAQGRGLPIGTRVQLFGLKAHTHTLYTRTHRAHTDTCIPLHLKPTHTHTHRRNFTTG